MSESTDPRGSITAFASLLARLQPPFADAQEELAKHDLTVPEWQKLIESWSALMKRDAAAQRLFEDTFARAHDHARSRTRGVVGSTTTARTNGAEPPAPTGDDETLAFAAHLPAPSLPFTPGDFAPRRSARAAEPRAPEGDPDATKPPVDSSDETLPFVKLPTFEQPKRPNKRGRDS